MSFNSPAPSVLKNGKLTRSGEFLQFLALGMFFDHASARRAVHWFEDCVDAWNRSEKDLGWATRSDAEKNRFVQALFRDVAERVASTREASRLMLGLSAGLDSRFLYHTLRELGIRVGTYTFGQVGNLDYDFSRWVDEGLNLSTRFFDTSETERVNLYPTVRCIFLDSCFPQPRPPVRGCA